MKTVRDPLSLADALHGDATTDGDLRPMKRQRTYGDSTDEDHESTLNSKDLDDERKSFDDCHPTLCKDMSPDAYIQKLFKAIVGVKLRVRPTIEISCIKRNQTKDESDRDSLFFKRMSQEDYEVDIATAVRDNDLDTLRTLHTSGRNLSCCNRYGESVLHTACRRGFASMVSLFIEEAGMPIRITDDCGRTPFHDALWCRTCQFEIMDLLLRREPELLLTCDKRGHTPLNYCRKEHWQQWKQFLYDRVELIREGIDTEFMQLFLTPAC